MERATQLSKLTQEKQNLEKAALHDKSALIQQEKERNAKDLMKKQQLLDEMAKSESQKLQENLTSKIMALEKEKKSLEEELNTVSTNESRLKKEISLLESKTKENKLSETRLMKNISDLQDKVSLALIYYRLKI